MDSAGVVPRQGNGILRWLLRDDRVLEFGCGWGCDGRIGATLLDWANFGAGMPREWGCWTVLESVDRVSRESRVRGR
jgi:hypothetical protein